MKQIDERTGKKEASITAGLLSNLCLKMQIDMYEDMMLSEWTGAGELEGALHEVELGGGDLEGVTEC